MKTDHTQWTNIFLDDESYGRNKGYYVLLEAFRDIFERGGEKNWEKSIDLINTDCTDIDKLNAMAVSSRGRPDHSFS